MNHLVCMRGDNLAEGVSLDVIGCANLNAGDGLLLCFNDSREEKAGRVVRIADQGARPVIESEGRRWWLRPVNVVRIEAVPWRTWKVGGEDDGD